VAFMIHKGFLLGLFKQLLKCVRKSCGERERATVRAITKVDRQPLEIDPAANVYFPTAVRLASSYRSLWSLRFLSDT
jgi:hypothetical protein